MKSKFLFYWIGLTLCLGGCTKTSSENTLPHTTEGTRHGGIVVFSSTTDPKSFNEIISAEQSTSRALGYLFEGLTRTNGLTGKVEPALARVWEHSDDGLSWVFTLREDVLWFDGHPFTADDVVFTYNDLIYNDEIPCSMRDLLTIDGEIFKVEKIDQYTVKIVTPVPYAPLLRHMGQSILPKHRLYESVINHQFTSTWGVNTPPEEIIGTGPYRLVEYAPAEKLVYERNPHYWKKDTDGERLPYIDKIFTIIVPNSDIEIAKFQAGEIDSLGVRPKDYAYLKPLENQGDFTIYDLGPAFGSTFLMFNQDIYAQDPVKRVWFSDKNFRQAVAYAINRKTIINNVFAGLAAPQDTPISEADPIFHNPETSQYRYDLVKAKNLLVQGGYVDTNGDGILEKPAGEPVQFIIVTNADNFERKDMAVIITENLRDLGFDVVFRTLDFNNLVQKLDVTRDWMCMILGLGGGNLEPHGGKNVWDYNGRLHMWNKKPASGPDESQSVHDNLKITAWKDSLPDWEFRVLELFNQGVQVLDTEKRAKYYFEWQSIVAEELPLIYLVTPKNFVAVRNKFDNLQPSSFAGAFHNFEELTIREHYRSYKK